MKEGIKRIASPFPILAYGVEKIPFPSIMERKWNGINSLRGHPTENRNLVFEITELKKNSLLRPIDEFIALFWSTITFEEK